MVREADLDAIPNPLPFLRASAAAGYALPSSRKSDTSGLGVSLLAMDHRTTGIGG